MPSPGAAHLDGTVVWFMQYVSGCTAARSEDDWHGEQIQSLLDSFKWIFDSHVDLFWKTEEDTDSKLQSQR
jgi:hypothetical protein